MGKQSKIEWYSRRSRSGKIPVAFRKGGKDPWKEMARIFSVDANRAWWFDGQERPGSLVADETDRA